MSEPEKCKHCGTELTDDNQTWVKARPHSGIEADEDDDDYEEYEHDIDECIAALVERADKASAFYEAEQVRSEEAVRILNAETLKLIIAMKALQTIRDKYPRDCSSPGCTTCRSRIAEEALRRIQIPNKP
jgi:hypothetical protein